MGLFKRTGEDPEDLDPSNIQGAFGKLEPDPRSSGRDDPEPKNHEPSFDCMHNHAHKTQAAADRCTG